MFQIKPYENSMQSRWTAQFIDYFLNDLGVELTADVIEEKVCAFILDQWRRGIVQMAVAFWEEEPIGFAVYQIDSVKSDWCQREGWGFIREFAITPSHRGRGYGRALATYVERDLYARGVPHIYLTADDAIDFWCACGYTDTAEENDNGTHDLVK